MTDTELLEHQAVAVALELRAVPLRDGEWDDESRYATADQLAVAWSEPPVRPRYGAFVSPLGPPADATALVARGVVWCPGNAYAYMGFEALRPSVEEPWTVVPVTSD